MTASWPPPPSAPEPVPVAPACYRHPRVPATVPCTRCDRPLCTDCMISAPVGWQCPSCVKGGPAVVRARDLPAFGGSSTRPPVTLGLMALCGLAYLGQLSDASLQSRYGISAIGVASGHLEQLVTSGFLHGSIIHIGFNMVLLYRLGQVLEARLGWVRFLGLYVVSLLGGSIGTLLLGPVGQLLHPDPRIVSIGASGAVFGLMGAALLLPGRVGGGLDSSLRGLLVINLVISFVPGLNIAVGGHLGGLALGCVFALGLRVIGTGREPLRLAGAVGWAVALAVTLVIAAGPIADASVSRLLG